MNNPIDESHSDLKISPMMAQWHACKKVAKDAVLFFRMGDFYEAFYEDASLISKELDLTLTKRQEIPMSGVPVHTYELYVDKLVAKGFRVAIAEQTEDPKKVKGLVKREVVRFVTPGTLISSSLLADKSNNFIASITQVGTILGLSFLDLTTAEFQVIEFDTVQELMNQVYRLRPSEIVVSTKFKEKQDNLLREIRQTFEFHLSTLEDWRFEHQTACDFLTKHFQIQHLEGFGLRGMVAAINAAGALLYYIKEQLCLSIEHICEIHPFSTSQYMSLDKTTQRNLELTESTHDGSRKNSLLTILDKTKTPMGGRLMRQWLKQPLLELAEIQQRQNALQALLGQSNLLETLSNLLEGVRDMERLMMRASTGYASPRDLVALKTSFEEIPRIKSLLQSLTSLSTLLSNEESHLDPLFTMNQLIGCALVDAPPAKLGDGTTFREGFNQELDELRAISRDSKSWIAQYQTQLRETTGIRTLKVGFNRLFGYYIEVSKGQTDRMPEGFERRQTLVNGERYITPELKEYELKVLTAEDRIAAMEVDLFTTLRREVARFSKQVFQTAQALAKIDCLQSLALVALQQGYIRPIIEESQILQIVEGRHPVIEVLCLGEKFIPNDTFLDEQTSRLLIITGPNMAGKSTYIRQVALIVIMAQIGSYVPAKSAQIGLVDKIFTRIGASDDLSRGQSTFMVEMTETANILHNATSRSLVILDEIGRGTSTYDGISIAWSVAEFLLTTEGRMAKTLFATHYWELTKMEEKIPGAVNYNVAVHESEDHIVFLRKIVRGGTDKSYGIHVGRLAGLPETVISRAKEILVHLEENANRKNAFEPNRLPKRTSQPKPKSKLHSKEIQLTFFGA